MCEEKHNNKNDIGFGKKNHGAVKYPDNISICYSPETPYFRLTLPDRMYCTIMAAYRKSIYMNLRKKLIFCCERLGWKTIEQRLGTIQYRYADGKNDMEIEFPAEFSDEE